MGPVDQSAAARVRAHAVPRLENGDRLTRVEFERRYDCMPENVKAELIDGVVYMASPTKAEHGDPHALIDGWLTVYTSETPGTRASSNATLRLDELSEPQPDALLRVLPENGGRSRLDEQGYVRGGVELVCEVAASSVSYDLHQKKAVYQRHACLEYLVVLVHEGEVRWFVHEAGEYVPLVPDAAGVLRSRVFPGLWLDPRAIVAGDAARVLAVLREGLASSDHAAFVERLSVKR
jgi:Uma2 family endonuclease